MQIAVDKTNLEKIDALGAHPLHALADRGLHGLLRNHGGLEDAIFCGAKHRLGGFKRRAELTLRRLQYWD